MQIWEEWIREIIGMYRGEFRIIWCIRANTCCYRHLNDCMMVYIAALTEWLESHFHNFLYLSYIISLLSPGCAIMNCMNTDIRCVISQNYFPNIFLSPGLTSTSSQDLHSVWWNLETLINWLRLGPCVNLILIDYRDVNESYVYYALPFLILVSSNGTIIAAIIWFGLLNLAVKWTKYHFRKTKM